MVQIFIIFVQICFKFPTFDWPTCVISALRVDKRPAAGSGPLITPDNKRQTIESELQGEPQEAPSSPPIQQGKLK